MLFPDQVKLLLLHANARVRDSAAWYFSRTDSKDPEVPKLIFDAVVRYGKEAHGFLYPCRDLLVDDQSLQSLIDLISCADNKESLGLLEEILVRVPLDVLSRNVEGVESALRQLTSDAPKRLRRRNELAKLSSAELWELLEQSPEDDGSGLLDLDDESLEDLILELVLRSEPSNQSIARQLVEFEEQDEEPAYIDSLVQLVGRRRIREAIPSLMRRLHSDDDWLQDAASDALARIGGLEVIRAIEADWPGSDTEFRVMARFVLRCIPLPEAEAALLRFLNSEKDIEIRSALCADLCAIFSEQGIEVVRQQIKEGYSENCDPLEDDLLPVLDALGIDLPEAEAWRAGAEERARQRELEPDDDELFDDSFVEEFVEKMNALTGRSLFPSPSLDEEPEPDVDVPMLHRHEPPSLPEYAEFVGQIRYESRHVGRNDHCPCGSGRKFKKCCGKS